MDKRARKRELERLIRYITSIYEQRMENEIRPFVEELHSLKSKA